MNKYNGLSRYRIGKIIFCFCLDMTATQTAFMLKLNRKTVNRYYNYFRRRIYACQDERLRQFFGTVEVDESYFGATRPRGALKRKRGRGTSKQPVFGIFERDGEVYTEIVPDVKKKTLQKVIRGLVPLDTVVISDGWRGYNGLVDVGYDTHLRITKNKNGNVRFVYRGIHINGIESFWSFIKRRLTKFNGVKKNFPLHLKECEWRWNKSPAILQKQLKMMV